MPQQLAGVEVEQEHLRRHPRGRALRGRLGRRRREAEGERTPAAPNRPTAILKEFSLVRLGPLSRCLSVRREFALNQGTLRMLNPPEVLSTEDI